MLKGVKKGEVSKSDYRIEEKGKGFYKVTDKITQKYRIMSKDKVESIFGKIKKEVEIIVKANLDEILENFVVENFKTTDLSAEDKKAIKAKCEELEIKDAKAYKDMIIAIIKKSE